MNERTFINCAQKSVAGAEETQPLVCARQRTKKNAALPTRRNVLHKYVVGGGGGRRRAVASTHSARLIVARQTTGLAQKVAKPNESWII